MTEKPEPPGQPPSGTEYENDDQDVSQHQCDTLRLTHPYACGWRDGFRAGAVDMLGLAHRELPDEAHTLLAVLARLADNYLDAHLRDRAS
jgi:hypothetical protein